MKQVFSEVIGDTKIVIVQAGDDFKAVLFQGPKRSIELKGDDLEGLKAALRNEAGKLHPNYFGIDGARARFLHFFRDGFPGAYYRSKERDYKVAASCALREAAPLDKALYASDQVAIAARKGLSTNLLSRFEAARLSETLAGANGAAFLRSAAQFCSTPSQAALEGMERALRPHGRWSWPLLTYLPFLWSYDDHMFLKPEATIDFATRTGHYFSRAYRSELDIDVYRSLLDLADTTARDIDDLQPADRIDIQSFIWIVGSYVEADYDAEQKA